MAKIDTKITAFSSFFRLIKSQAVRDVQKKEGNNVDAEEKVNKDNIKTKKAPVIRQQIGRRKNVA